MTILGRKLRHAANAPVSRCTTTVILEQEHFQSFPEHWQ